MVEGFKVKVAFCFKVPLFEVTEKHTKHMKISVKKNGLRVPFFSISVKYLSKCRFILVLFHVRL